MAYSPAKTNNPGRYINFYPRFEHTKLKKDSNVELRGFWFSGWSHHFPTVVDPAGQYNMMRFGYITKKHSFTLTLFEKEY
jgi:hypothetical protein